MAKDMFVSMSVSASGMSAQRKRMETIAENIANADATRSAEGGPYRRKETVFRSVDVERTRNESRPEHQVSLHRTSPAHLPGRVPSTTQESISKVEASEVQAQEDLFDLVYEPGHPDADEEGFVRMPNVNTVTQMVDMIAATRAYEANLSAMKAYQAIVEKSLEI